MNLAYFFCIDPANDRVGPAAYEASLRLHRAEASEVVCDGQAVYQAVGPGGHHFAFIPTAEVASHNFPRYAPLLNGPFAGWDLAGIVNWHEGGNAPDSIFCAHTSGDVPTGVFGIADPRLTSAVLNALEAERIEAGLDNWSTRPEATHFSGVPYGSDPSVIRLTETPVIDIEIGSSPPCWSDPIAIEALARALVRVPSSVADDAVPILFVGGVHFEPSLAGAVVSPSGPAFAIGHVLPNQWLTPELYRGAEGIACLRAAAEATRGGVRGLVFHEGIKGPVKDAVRGLAAQLGVPAIKHKRLRDGQTALVV